MRVPRGRGARGRGRGGPRMPMLAPRHRVMPPPEFPPPPPPYGISRGRGPMRMRPGPSMGYPRGRMDMGYPEIPPSYLPPTPGYHPGERLPPLPRPLGMRPPPPSLGRMPPYPHMAPPGPVRPPLMAKSRPWARTFRGRTLRGKGVRRLGAPAANGGAKKSKKKNKMRTVESESEKPWVNEALKAEIVKKYELYATAKEKMTDGDWQAWKDQRVLVGKMVHAAKLEYIGLHPEVVPSEFFCDACDRGCKSAELLAEHIAAHVTCGRDGCQFTAQPKVVLKHVQVQHDTGLYLRIRSENPEDVAKWIAERKNRFPTKENVERRLAQKREMFQRGERISSEGRRFPNRNQRENRREHYIKRNSEISAPAPAPTQLPVNPIKDCVKRDITPIQVRVPSSSTYQVQVNNKDNFRDFDSWRGALPKFPGTAAFPLKESKESCKEELHISDEEEEVVETKSELQNLAKRVRPVSGILAALMADYGSDMTETEDEDGSLKSKGVAVVVEMNHKIENIVPAQDKQIPLKERETQLKLCEEKQKSGGIMKLLVDPDKTPRGGESGSREHKSNITDTNQVPFPQPPEATIRPGGSQTEAANKLELSSHNADSSVVADKNDEDSDSGPEEQRIEHKDTSGAPVPKPAEDRSKPVETLTNDRSEPSKMPRSLPVRQRLPRHQLSLLEKLLGNEMRQERNMILQCVHYVVKNNFFDKETTK